MDNYLFKKNVRGWKPTENDYRLIFRPIDGLWREISGNVAKYNNAFLADYLQSMEIDIPYGCQFCRVKTDDLNFEYRDYGSYVRIDVLIKK